MEAGGPEQTLPDPEPSVALRGLAWFHDSAAPRGLEPCSPPKALVALHIQAREEEEIRQSPLFPRIGFRQLWSWSDPAVSSGTEAAQGCRKRSWELLGSAPCQEVPPAKSQPRLDTHWARPQRSLPAPDSRQSQEMPAQ